MKIGIILINDDGSINYYNFNNSQEPFPSWQEAINGIDDSRFTVMPDKDKVRTGARIMYDRLYVMLNERIK